MGDDRLYAVLSGDIVGSRRFMGKGPAVRDAIKSAYRECAEAFTDALGGMPAVDVFAGDSWQMLVRSPEAALRVGLCMRTLIRSNDALPEGDTRVALGIGAVDFLVRERVSESQGEAFALSGEALDDLQRMKVRMNVRLPEAGNGRPFDPQDTLEAMMALTDAICQEWTPAQSAAVAGALMRLDQTRIGERLSITQSAVSQALHAARWWAVERVLEWWETAEWATYNPSI